MSVKVNKSISIIFISTCATFLLFLFLSQWNFLNNLSYRLHEICYLPVYIGMFLIPIEAVVGIAAWMRNRKNGDKTTIVNHLLNSISVIAFFLCVSIYIFLMNGVTSSGVIKDIEVHSVNQGYYIMLDNNMVEISDGQVSNIDNTKQWYRYEYKYNKLVSNKYTMTIFEVDPMQ